MKNDAEIDRQARFKRVRDGQMNLTTDRSTDQLTEIKKDS